MPRCQSRPAAILMFLLLLVVPMPISVFAGGLPPSGAQVELSVTELTAEYPGELGFLIEQGVSEPLSLATADFDEDGMPDLVVGYGDGNAGLVALHRGNIEAVYPKPGQDASEPFHPVAEVFATPQRADLIGSGDFDADGRFDVVIGTLGGSDLLLMRGNGAGSLSAAERIPLNGALTTMAVGEVNRRDGLTDVVVGIDQPSGSKILVFESPAGALRGIPETINTSESAMSIEFGRIDDDGFQDMVVASDRSTRLIRGRDRRLTSTRSIRRAVADPIIERWSSPVKETATSMLRELDDMLPGPLTASVEVRLNRDALPDHVVIVADEYRPWVVKTLSRAVFTVDSTDDDADFSTADGVCDTDDSVGDGPCTLRAAIEQANASAGADAIEFAVSGTGPHTIQPATPLPSISEAVTLDGFTQPGSAANTISFPGGLDSVMQIEIDGSLVAIGNNGLHLTAGGNTIRGLVVNGFLESGVTNGSGIHISGVADNIIEGNFIGCDPGGTTHRPNSKGIQLYGGSDNNTIGGLAPAARNLIAGNGSMEVRLSGSGNIFQGNLFGSDITGTQYLYAAGYGIFLDTGSLNTVGGGSPTAGNLVVNTRGWGVYVYAPDSLIQGNIIGTDINGTGWLSNQWGIFINSGSNIQIGGTAAGQGNLISGNNEAGIRLENGIGCRILGNTIGTLADGVTNRGNSGEGIGVYSTGPTGNEIGGTTPGSGNIIAYNGWGSGGWGAFAVLVVGPNNTGNSILGNSTFGTPEWWLGIDLGLDLVTANDPGDADSGPNNLQNYPIVTGVSSGGTAVEGTLNSTPSTEFHVEFFANPACHSSGHGDGKLFLGSDSVTTDASGDVSFSSAVTTAAPAGSFITASATDPNGNTSEFSACFQYSPSADLQVSVDDGVTEVLPGDPLTYTIVASNAGPDGLAGATFSTAFAFHLSCSTTCVAAGGATCSPGPVVDDIEEDIVLPVGGTATYTAVCDVDYTATGIIETLAAIDEPIPGLDPNPTNNFVDDINTVLPVDWGDAPEPAYPTMPVSDGARHQIGGGLHLGSTVDVDPGGQPTPGADGDDADGTDDEDGVTFTSIAMTGFNADLEVSASAAGLLNVWLDFDRNGSWLDPGEQIFTDEPLGPGINPLSFPVPASAIPGDSFARFRFDSGGGLAPTGYSADGEVEDELLEIRFSTLDVAETGQTTSYAAGDDGTFQTGEPWPDPRFTDNGDGTVTDELTGLMWTQDNVTPGPAPCNPGVTRDWFLSLSYVDCLNTNIYLGHDDWRMPNVVEMNSLVDLRVYDQRPTWNSQGFTMTATSSWWSSTTTASGLAQVHSLSSHGSTTGRNKAAVSGTAVWPVRGGPGGGAVQLQASGQVRCWDASYSEVPCAGTGQDGDHLAGAPWPSPRFEVSGDCVTDRLTGLTWTKDANPFGHRNWYNAVNDALGLSLCGFDDWRLPTVLELKSLNHFDKRTDPVPGSLWEWWESRGFVNVTTDPSWSGTSHPGNPELVAFTMFSEYTKDRDDHLVVWPVRGNVQSQIADLTVVVSDSEDPVAPTANVVYTVGVSNLGPTTVDEVTLTNTLPAGAVFVGATGSGWTCGEDTGVVTCTYGGLSIGSAPPISIEIATPNTPGATLTNSTLVDALLDDPVAENNAAEEATTIIGPDFGDAPDPTYPTLLASDGARHSVGGALFLGATVDSDPDGQPTAGADGDDLDGTDDEDGVTFPSALRLGLDASVQVEASLAGLLNAWVDFNADGDWDDPGEQIFTDTPLTAGTNNLSAAVPIDATLGATFARFRVDSTGGLTPTGAADDGEVEDYALTIEPSAELGVNIGDSPDPVRQGRRLTYSVAVDNNGGLDATGVVLTDTLDGNVSFVSASLPACSETGGVVTCTLDTLSAGTSAMVFIEVDVNATFAGTLTNTAVVALNEEDPVPANNTDTETTTAVAPGPHIFSDGFETGDTTRWSSTTGG